MFESPFPIDIGFCLINCSENFVHEVQPEEMALVQSWESKERSAQFLAGRAAARRAAGRIAGQHPAEIALGPVLRGDQKEPIWPAGYIGSITHCNDWAASAVTTANSYIGIGIDLETTTRDLSLIAKRICHKEELAWINADSKEVNLRTALIFSSKESIYKTLYPIYRKNLGFKDATLRITDDSGVLTASISKSTQIPEMHREFPVGFVVKGRYVLTYVTLPVI